MYGVKVESSNSNGLVKVLVLHYSGADICAAGIDFRMPIGESPQILILPADYPNSRKMSRDTQADLISVQHSSEVRQNLEQEVLQQLMLHVSTMCPVTETFLAM